MDKLTKNQKNIIDRYYNEDDNHVEIHEELIFQEKLKHSLSKMDIPDTDTDAIDINIMGIIGAADQIKQEKNSQKEFITFIFVSALILFLFSTCIFIFGQKLFIYLEISILMLLPLSLIIFGVFAVNKGRVK